MKIKVPKQAIINAKNALIANKIYKDNKCATLVGKRRAVQIINDQYLSEAIAIRTYSYLSRAKVYNHNDWTKCGTISYNLWGGEEMLQHLKRVLKKNKPK